MSKEFWTSNMCCIITGASRGFGKEICRYLAKRFLRVNTIDGKLNLNKKISFVLLSRDQSLLDELQKEIDSLSSNVHVIEVITGPLEDSKTIKNFKNSVEIFGEIGPKYDHALLIHNAGSLGNPNKLVLDYSSEDSDFLNNYVELNLLSTIKLSSAFLKAFSSSPQRTIVNITSLLALEPYKGLSLYGSIKAARDSFFRSVALECPNTTVLSYAPGILDTEMANILKKEGFNKEIYLNSSNILKPQDSAAKLVYLLENNLFKNGDHVDYYSVNKN